MERNVKHAKPVMRDCDECGTTVEQSTLKTRKGEMICTDCATDFDENHWCDTCGHEYEDNDMAKPGLCVYCQEEPPERY